MKENFIMRKEWARYDLTVQLERFSRITSDVEKKICIDMLQELLELNKVEKWRLLDETENISKLVIKTFDLKVIKLFIDYGIIFNTESLMTALENENIKIASFLIDLGVELNHTCRNEFTPLVYLMSVRLNKNYFLIEKLLQNGANPNFSKDNILIILFSGSRYNLEDLKKVLKLLIKYNVNVSYNNNEALFYAASHIHDYEVFESLLNTANCGLETPFICAAVHNNEAVLKSILSSGTLLKREIVLAAINYFANNNISYTNFIKLLLKYPVGIHLAKDILPIVQNSNHKLRDIWLLKKAIISSKL